MAYDDKSRWGNKMGRYKIFIAKAFLFMMLVVVMSTACFFDLLSVFNCVLDLRDGVLDDA